MGIQEGLCAFQCGSDDLVHVFVAFVLRERANDGDVRFLFSKLLLLALGERRLRGWETVERTPVRLRILFGHQVPSCCRSFRGLGLGSVPVKSCLLGQSPS